MRTLGGAEDRASSAWALFDAVTDAVSEGLLVVDASMNIEFCNGQAERMFGYQERELAGRSLSALFPAHQAQLTKHFDEFMSLPEERDPAVSLLARTRDGHDLSTALVLSQVASRQSGLVVASIREVDRSQPSRPRGVDGIVDPQLQKQLEQAPRSTAILDREGRVSAVNDAWHRLELENEDQTILWAGIGEPFCDALVRGRNATAELVRQGVRSVLSGASESFEHLYRAHSSAELRWYRLRARRFEGAAGAVVVDQLDVTDVQLAHARLKIQNTVTLSFNARLPILAACRELALALCEELDWDFAGIWTLDAPTWKLRCVDTWVRPELGLFEFERASRGVSLGPGTGLPGLAWSTAKVQWITDADLDHSRSAAGKALPLTIMPPAAFVAGFRTALCFPVKCGDDMLAVIELFSCLGRPEDRALMDLLELSGDQLALWELRERAERSATAAQRQADESRVQLESVLECTPAFITAIDRSGKIIFVNRTIPEDRRATAIGAPWRDFVVPEHQHQTEAALRAVFTTGASTEFEVKVPLPNGQWRWFNNYMGRMRSGDEVVGAVVISQDVTETKRSHQELLAAQRLAAVGTLAAGVAHEINTPIQFVSDSVQFLRDATKDVFDLIDKLQAYHRLSSEQADASALQRASQEVDDAEQTADLEYIHEKVPRAFERCIDGLERVATIVRSMKEFAHPGQKDMAPIDLNRAIIATLTVARNEYKYVADVETELADLPLVTCHANDINQVVLNIVVNAAHAIADRQKDDGRGVITVKTECDGPWVTISIRDTGGGIPEHARPHIFDPFFTTKEVGRGTGQGLSIAWTTITEKHGGVLSFDTELGKGTTFYIRLPVAGHVSPR